MLVSYGSQSAVERSPSSKTLSFLNDDDVHKLCKHAVRLRSGAERPRGKADLHTLPNIVPQITQTFPFRLLPDATGVN